jgi:hypothetical protein
MPKKIKVVDVETNLEQTTQPAEPVIQSEDVLQPVPESVPEVIPDPVVEPEQKVKKARPARKATSKEIHALSEAIAPPPEVA